MKTSYWIGISLLIAGGIIGLAISFGTCSDCQADQSTAPIADSVNAATFKKGLAETKNAQLLDIRTAQEFGTGHLAGAKNIDFYQSDFADQIAALDRNTPYFIYCNSGNRSGQALTLMEQKGFSTVYNLAGGIQAWSQSGYQVE